MRASEEPTTVIASEAKQSPTVVGLLRHFIPRNDKTRLCLSTPFHKCGDVSFAMEIASSFHFLAMTFPRSVIASAAKQSHFRRYIVNVTVFVRSALSERILLFHMDECEVVSCRHAYGPQYAPSISLNRRKPFIS